MKIGLVCPYSINKGGGVQEQVRAQLAELTRLGHETYIITPRPRGSLSSAMKRKTIFVGNSTDLNSPTRTTVQVSAGVNEDIDKMLEKHQFDILHFHEPWVPMLSMQILSRSKCVNIATFHAKLPETMMSRTIAKVVTPYTKSILNYIHEFVAVSDAAADYLGSMTDRPVTIIPNGVDLNKFKPPRSHKEDNETKTILYVGRLEARKGVKYLLRAFARLREIRPDVKLLLAGDGADKRKLEVLAQDLDISDSVTFLGYVSEAEKIRLLKTSDLFCSPALYGESFGIVLIEAMATGTVTVAGDNPGYSAVMKGLGAISLINPRHKEEFARRLDLLIRETDLRKIWRNWAKSEVRQYGFPRIFKRYEQLYEQALKDHEVNQDSSTPRERSLWRPRVTK